MRCNSNNHINNNSNNNCSLNDNGNKQNFKPEFNAKHVETMEMENAKKRRLDIRYGIDWDRMSADQRAENV